MQFCPHPTSFFAFPLEELGYWTIENEHQLGLESSSSATFKAIRSRLSIYIATLRSEFPLEILMLLSRGRSTGLQASFESQNDINKCTDSFQTFTTQTNHNGRNKTYLFPATQKTIETRTHFLISTKLLKPVK